MQPPPTDQNDERVTHDSIPARILHDSMKAANTHMIPDSTTTDTANSAPKKSSIKTTINYTAQDSIRFNVKEQTVYLFGDAHVDYGDVKLEADRITINWETKDMIATYSEDSTGKKKGIPVMTDDGQEYEAHRMRYNYGNKRATISNLLTHQNEGYLRGEETYKSEDDIMYIKDGSFCPCDDPDAGTYIKANKLKVIPGKQVVTGPFLLHVADLPTIIGFPFGMFPIQSEEKTSGIIFPGYRQTQNRGFSITDGGFFWYINDHVATQMTGEIYTLGGWGLFNKTQYNKRYHYSGSADFSFRRVVQNADEFTRSETDNYRLRWQHRPVSRGGKSFSANVEIATATYNRQNEAQPQAFMSNTLNSNVNYSTPLGKGPFSLNMSARHDQNINDNTFNFTLPSATVSMRQVRPFESRGGGRKSAAKQFIESINFSYRMNAKNEISNNPLSQRYSGINVANLTARDTAQLAINADNFNNLMARSQFGIQHRIPVSASISLGELNINPSLTYTEIWAPAKNSYEEVGENTYIVEKDRGFQRAYEYSGGVNATTTLYGFYGFRNSKTLFRQTFRPNVGMNFSPDYRPEGRFDYNVALDPTDPEGRSVSRYVDQVYRPSSGGPSANMSMSLQSAVEMKYFPKSDTSGKGKKVQLIRSMSANTGYNFIADEFKLQPFRLNLNTTAANFINILLSANIDPYLADSVEGRIRRIDEYAWDNGQGIGHLENINATLGFSLNPRLFSKENGKEKRDGWRPMQYNYNNWGAYQLVDFSVKWDLNVGYNLNVRFPRFDETNVAVHSIDLRGQLSLTEKWNVSYNLQYALKEKEIVNPVINITRDLGCWEARLMWVPTGALRSYSFEVNIKSPMFRDILKLRRENRFQDRVF